jgi:tRNA(Ile)-lysidine synthase
LISFEALTCHIDLDKKIYVGYSGGPDSTALLHLLHSNNISNIEAIHINHNLSSNSAEWEGHCRQMAKKLGIRCHVESVEIKIDGDGLESAARKARYKIFTKYLQEGDQILLGHHSNDVAETFLLRLFRGTGVDGLESLNVKRVVGNGYLVRPLINLTKEEIMMYLKENNICYIKDESNYEQEQDRNYIRNNIIPSIEQRWMKASSRISNTSDFIKIKNQSYEILFQEKFKHLIKRKIKVKDLKEIEEQFVVDIIRHSIKKQNIAMPSKKVIEEIIKTFLQSNPGPKSLVAWTRADNDQPGGEICYQDGCIIIGKKQ